MVRRFLVPVTSAIGFCVVTANAADLYGSGYGSGYGGGTAGSAYAPVASWTGFYAGGNIGYGADLLSRHIDYTDAGSIAARTPVTFGFADISNEVERHGAFGGGQFGYNYRYGRMVYSVETDFQFSDISDSVSGLTAFGRAYGVKSTVDWFGTLRGRIGYSYDSFLVYLTAGLAYGDLKERIDFESEGGPMVRFRSNDIETGYVLGGGVEYRFDAKWSVKGEYQYIDFGQHRYGLTFNPTGVGGDVETVRTNGIDNNFHTIRIGVNYHFSSNNEPLK